MKGKNSTKKKLGLPGMETELATTIGFIPSALIPTSLFIV